ERDVDRVAGVLHAEDLTEPAFADALDDGEAAVLIPGIENERHAHPSIPDPAKPLVVPSEAAETAVSRAARLRRGGGLPASGPDGLVEAWEPEAQPIVVRRMRVVQLIVDVLDLELPEAAGERSIAVVQEVFGATTAIEVEEPQRSKSFLRSGLLDHPEG